MDTTFTFEGTTPEELADEIRGLESRIAEEIVNVADELALRIVADAKREAPVDTGRLRASLDFDVSEPGDYTVRIAVGSNVEYAIYQEVDNPYLRPAFEANRDTIEEYIKQAVESAVEG